MKKLFVVALLSIMAMETSFAQTPTNEKKHIVGVAVGSLLGRPRIKYEYLYNEKYSFGAIMSVYTGNPRSDGGDYFTGVMLSPIGRYYFGQAIAGNGWYLQAKPNLGVFQEQIVYTGDNPRTEKGKSFVSVGLGGNFGYQFNINKTNWHIDANVGLKFSSHQQTSEGVSYWSSMTEAGSILDTHLSIGYRF